jgi:ankyrin repeat protein
MALFFVPFFCPSTTTERMKRIDQELIDAARENNLPEVSRLLSVGADVNAKDNDGCTPLHEACWKGHVQVFQALLDHGADIEAKTRFKSSTPLHWASLNAHLDVVKALRSGGANILVVNNIRRLPIHLALREGHSEVAKYLLQELYAAIREFPLHELLKDFTLKCNPNSVGVPPLRYAVHLNVLGTDDVVEIIEFLVDRNPELLRSRDRDASLPLHVACRRGASFSIVQCLVNRYKASVKSVTPEGDLPLFLACEMPEPSLDTVFLLFKLYPDLVYRQSLENRCGGSS